MDNLFYFFLGLVTLPLLLFVVSFVVFVITLTVDTIRDWREDNDHEF